MEQLPESFAKAATKQRFQDLISGRSRSRKASSSNVSIQEADQPLSPKSNHSEDRVTVQKETTTFDVPFSPVSLESQRRPDDEHNFPAAEAHGDFNRGMSPDNVGSFSGMTGDRFRPEYGQDLEKTLARQVSPRSPTPLSPQSRQGTASSSGSRKPSGRDIRSVQVVGPIAYIERRVTSQTQLSPLSRPGKEVTSRQLSRISMDRSSRGDMSDPVIQMTESTRSSKSPSVLSVEVENEVEVLRQPPIRPRRRKESSLLDIRTFEVDSPSSVVNEEQPSVQLKLVGQEALRLYRKRRQASKAVERMALQNVSDSVVGSEDATVILHYDRITWTTSTSGRDKPADGDVLELLPKDSQEARLSRLRSKVVSAQELLHQAGDTTVLNGQASQRSTQGEPRISSARQHERAEVRLPERVLGVRIHRTDKLVGHFDLPNALVRISVLEGRTGKLLPKSAKDGTQSDHWSPAMTGICDLPSTELAFPSWEESIVFGDKFQHFFQTSENLMFFELCTFTPFGNLAGNSDGGKIDPFRCFAWAFLKLTNSTLKTAHNSQRIRVQLFKPGKVLQSKSSSVDMPHVYRWWNAKHHSKYPATLHVTLTELAQPAITQPTNQPDAANSTYQHLKSLFGVRPSVADALAVGQDVFKSEANYRGPLEDGAPNVTRNRLPAEPDAASFSLDVSPEGVSAVRFSKDGRSLACGGLEKIGLGCVKVYEIPGGTLKGTFRGLCGIVYGLEWSSSSDTLLSACADGTVKMWNTLTFHPKPVVSLFHPGFVYCASFHPQNSSVVASGCYDGVIRIWSIDVEKSTYTLLQELTGHVGLINVVIFDRSGDQLYSGGSDGLVRHWSKDSSQGSAPLFDYRITNTTPTGLSQNVIIVDLKIRNEAKQLICTTQSGELSFVELNGFVLLRQISFSQPFKYRIRGALTPDEKRLYVGSAQSEVNIVDLDRAKLIQTTGSGLSCGVPVDIDHHPTQHLIAFCALGVGEKVIVRITNKPKQDLPRDPDQLSLPPERSLTTSPSGSSHPDKVSELIRKLDAITDDMKQREQLRSRTPLATHIRTSANRWRSDLSYSSVGGPVLSGAAPNGLPSKLIAGLIPNFSQIGVPARLDY